MTKTELLADNRSTPPVHFVDGTPVPSSDSVKYLGSHITWSNPTKKAIDARKALAHTRYMKLQPLWRSKLKDRVKFTKGTKRGHPQRYCLELITETALPVLKEYAEYTAQEHRHDVLGIRQMLNKDLGFKESGDCADAPRKACCRTCTATGMRMAAVRNCNIHFVKWNIPTPRPRSSQWKSSFTVPNGMRMFAYSFYGNQILG